MINVIVYVYSSTHSNYITMAQSYTRHICREWRNVMLVNNKGDEKPNLYTVQVIMAGIPLTTK